jgi:hypothetical protein
VKFDLRREAGTIAMEGSFRDAAAPGCSLALRAAHWRDAQPRLR